MRRVVLVIVSSVLASSGAAQEVGGPPGPRLLLERDHEIRLARSAAPKSVTANARVWYFDRGKYVIADSGSNGIECYVSRSWPKSLEPHCFDEEGARTIMKMEMRGVEFAHAGVSGDEARKRFEGGLADGSFALPTRPAMSWMMSSAQVLYNDEGQRAGAWRPHVMIYFPNLPPGALGSGAPDVDAGMLVSPGQPTSNITIVVPNFVDPEPLRGKF